MTQVLIAWIEKQIESGADGKVLELLTKMREVTQDGGLEGLRGFLQFEAMMSSMLGEQFDGGVAVGLLGGVEWLQAIEAENTVESAVGVTTGEAVA